MILLGGISGLWLYSAWRDDTVSLNLNGANYALGLQRGTIFVGYSEIFSLDVRTNRHTQRHAFSIWWWPQVLSSHRGFVVMIPLWIPFALSLGLLAYLKARRSHDKPRARPDLTASKSPSGS